jgi:hypothetical protein
LMVPLSLAPFCSNVSIQFCVPPRLFCTRMSHLPAMLTIESDGLSEGAACARFCGVVASGATLRLPSFNCTTRVMTSINNTHTTSLSCLTSQSKYALISAPEIDSFNLIADNMLNLKRWSTRFTILFEWGVT